MLVVALATPVVVFLWLMLMQVLEDRLLPVHAPLQREGPAPEPAGAADREVPVP
ncbi:hypothetical protein [Thermoactinospora rubra]|uniref:hypothetical protein n=1 Tax=Thermoactinospora rubra TaxID=1088767 RepID=UPI001301A73F|nr:hypothetical protein [Thermoactinospora rubra]